MMSKQICRKKMLGQHFRYHQTPGQMHCAVQMVTNIFMTARQKLTMLNLQKRVKYMAGSQTFQGVSSRSLNL